MVATQQWLTDFRVEALKIRKKQTLLMQALMKPPLMTAGTLNIQYRRCGKSGCACMRETNPVKHGPYHYLAVKTSKGLRLKYLKDKEEIQQLKDYRRYSQRLSQYQKNQQYLFKIFQDIRKKACDG
jgi:hypothetical protein